VKARGIDKEAARLADLQVRWERRHRHQVERMVMAGGTIEHCPCGEVRRFDDRGQVIGYVPGRRDLVLA